ncbi:Alpha-1 2-mannosidase OS=Streptomyces fumanus OX=67302 GN=GCM10018772_39070 PE=4 SV=1 [Streptomyces fumanus]
MTSVDLPVAEETKAMQYTLTSPKDRASAPTGWKLQGSADEHDMADAGRTLRPVLRLGPADPRVLGTDTEGAYAKYRLVLDGEHTLAEVELLG